MHKVRTDGIKRVVQTQRSTILTPEDVDAFVAQMRLRYDRLRLVEDVFNSRTHPTEEHPDPRLVYLDSACDARKGFLQLWQEPIGWEPDWTDLSNARGPHLTSAMLANPPRVRLDIFMNREIPVGRDGVLMGEIGAIYRTDDDEARAFVREAWKALRKVASDLAPRDLKWWGDVKARYPKDQVRKTGIWVGFHALRRAEELGIPVFSNFAWRPGSFPEAS